MNIETVLRHIDPKLAEAGWRSMTNAGSACGQLAAKATVRVLYGTGGWGSLLFLGLKGAELDPHGFDAGKLIKVKKRHVLVDALGLVLHGLAEVVEIRGGVISG